MASDPEAIPDDRAEAELVRKARGRSADAWSSIYDACYPKVYRYCHARCGNEAIAAELASSVFLEALRGIDRYEYRGKPLLAWLYRIAHNLLSDHLRKHRREQQAVQESLLLAEQHDPGPATDVVNREAVRSVLPNLTDEQQQVIALRFFADASTREIAAAMNKSESAVYSLEVRALAALRRALTQDRRDGAVPTRADKNRRVREIDRSEGMSQP